MQYYKTRYVPNNLTFIVVGDVDAEKVRQQLIDLFKPYPEKSLKPVFIPTEPPQLGRREVHQEFATELTHLSLAWHIPEVTNPDVPALDLLSTILGEGRSSRLYRRVREEAGLAFRISAFSYTPGDPGLFGIDATVDPKKREAAEQLALQIVDEVKQTGVTADELTKAKKISLSHHLGALTTMRGQASDLGSNWLLTRNLNFSRDYLDAVQKVTLDDIKRVAATISDREQSDGRLAESERLRWRQNGRSESRLPPVRFKNLNYQTDCVFWFAKILVCRWSRWAPFFAAAFSLKIRRTTASRV